MNTDVGILGNQQASLTALSTTLSETQTVLTAQLSNAQDVDMASTLSNLSLVQTQLQESYQLISRAACRWRNFFRLAESAGGSLTDY